jgi:hypothetical protein
MPARAPAVALLVALTLAPLLPRPTPAPAATLRPPLPWTLARVQAALAQLPVSFVPNAGQAPPELAVVARLNGYQLGLGATAAVLVPPAPKPTSQAADCTPPLAAPGRPGVACPAVGAAPLRLEWVGATPAEPLPEAPLPGRVSYFLGSDPSQWRAGLPTYARVRQAQLWPGIDLVHHGVGGRWEHDFVVAPGASVEAIRVRYAGAAGVAVAADGSLEVALADGSTWRQAAPAAYQVGAGG